MIRGLPKAHQLQFRTITLLTRKPIPVDQVKKGKTVPIQDGVVVPEKATQFEGCDVDHCVKVKDGCLCAEQIKRIKHKVRGSRQHNKFSYKVRAGIITGSAAA